MWQNVTFLVGSDYNINYRLEGNEFYDESNA